MDSFSIQFDAPGERTLDKNNDGDQTIGDLTLAAHASYRDPETYLVGLFGGGGWTFDHGDDEEGNMHFYFIGAEAQYYWNNFTLYGQADFLDGEDFYLEIPEMAWFGRGAASYYYTPDKKITGELSYLSGENNRSGSRCEINRSLSMIGY
ncbi:MAG TPA: hypothetical protein VKN63_02110 [Afifellaceae bacterium]|nr:hypothetical protein [Afifellaceae bacterium]